MIKARYHLHRELIHCGNDGSKLFILAVAEAGEVSVRHCLDLAVRWDAIVDTSGAALEVVELELDGAPARLDQKLKFVEDSEMVTGWRFTGGPTGKEIRLRVICSGPTLLGFRVRAVG